MPFDCGFDNYTFFEMHEREQERRRKADREDDCYWDEREEREVCDI